MVGHRDSPVSSPQGFTADVLAESADGSMKFGVEVTGISGAVKKDSNKLTQVMDFERVKENGEKTILAANTFRHDPLSARSSKDDFTAPVVDFLSRHPILLMTTQQLYSMVGDVISGSADGPALVQLLHEQVGVLDYP